MRPAPLERLQGALRGRYRIERELSRGGSAIVYLADDLRQPRTVALKVLRPDLASLVGSERFLREIEISAQLNHPHILPLFDAGDADGLPWFVMPYVEGESLRQRMLREEQLPVPEALRITREVGNALAYAHARGIVHRDIKPENILLSHGHALVADFGIARAVEAAGHNRLTETGMAVGTAEYMSPEQATGKGAVDGRSDQYSLACVLYEMLVGGPPFSAPTSQAVLARQLIDPVPPIRTVRSSVPVLIEAAILAALAKSKADRFPTIEAFIEGLEGKRPSPSRPYAAGPAERPFTRTALLLGGFALLAVALGAVVIRGEGARSGEEGPLPLDPNLVAVAPFDVLDREYQVWGEGMTPLLAGSLDGAGPMRAVPPSEVARVWSGRADRATAADLARRAGAGLAVYGWLVPSGADSLRLTATLLDLTGGGAIEIEVREHESRIDRAADSLAVRIVRELGRTRPIAAVRSAGLGSTSGPALKAYLAGEQYYRRNLLDSAELSYRRAVEMDSTFGLAWHRRALVRQLRTPENDDTVTIWALRAGALNRGLPARDSMLILADSLYRTVQKDYDPTGRERQRRLYATLEEATRRYPEDPEAWYLLGRAGIYTPRIPAGWNLTLEALNRAIALDSGFAPPTGEDGVRLALRVGNLPEARRHLRLAVRIPYLSPARRDGLRLAERMLSDPRTTLRQLQRWLDSSSTDAIGAALSILGTWPDSAEAAVRLARAVLARPTPPGDSAWMPGTAREEAHLALLFRGHLKEGFRTHRGRQWAPLFAAVALYGGVPPDSAAAAFTNPRPPRYGEAVRESGLPWWGREEDTVRLSYLVRHFDSARHAATSPEGRNRKHWNAERARAYLSLARRDTAQAILQFFSVIDSTCWGCSYSWHVTDIHALAPLLWAQGRDREAEPYLDYYNITVPVVVLDVALTLQRARVAERLGHRDRAIADYRRFARAWAYADGELRPMVEEARAALRRLKAGGVWQE